MNASKSRIDYIDTAKGLCILFVVFHHMEQIIWYHTPIDQYLRPFRMPLYFFLSGLFFKTYEGFFGFLKRKTNKLLIPFLSFYLLTTVLISWIKLLINGQGIDISLMWRFIGDETFYNNGIWFLWCLFIINILFYIIYSLSEKICQEKKNYFIIGISILLGCLGYYFSQNNVNLLAFIDTAFTSIPFFCIGYMTKKTQFLYPNKFDKYNVLIILLFIILLIFTSTGKINYRTNFFEPSLIDLYVSGVSGLFVVLIVSKMIGKLPVISYLGRFSIIILVTHQLLLPYFIKLGYLVSDRKSIVIIVSLILLIASYYLIIPFMVRYFGYITAQKDVIKIK